MSDGRRLTISERAIAARRARHRSSVENTAPPREANRDPWFTAGPSWGRPDTDQGPRKPADGWLERAEQALNNGSDARFRNLVSRFSRLFEW
jgi:hypothetical protein